MVIKANYCAVLIKIGVRRRKWQFISMKLPTFCESATQNIKCISILAFMFIPGLFITKKMYQRNGQMQFIVVAKTLLIGNSLRLAGWRQPYTHMTFTRTFYYHLHDHAIEHRHIWSSYFNILRLDLFCVEWLIIQHELSWVELKKINAVNVVMMMMKKWSHYR